MFFGSVVLDNIPGFSYSISIDVKLLLFDAEFKQKLDLTLIVLPEYYQRMLKVICVVLHCDLCCLMMVLLAY